MKGMARAGIVTVMTGSRLATVGETASLSDSDDTWTGPGMSVEGITEPTETAGRGEGIVATVFMCGIMFDDGTGVGKWSGQGGSTLLQLPVQFTGSARTSYSAAC
jgi:hypothetical protein